MRLTFLGTDVALPAHDNDASSFLIDGLILVDAGLTAYARLAAVGAEPAQLQSALLTHWHHDHFIGLAGVLFAVGMKGVSRPTRPQLQLVGPRPDFDEQVKRLRDFLWLERYPEIGVETVARGVASGDEFALGDYRVRVLELRHNVPSVAYRFELNSRPLVTICGDTRPCPELADFCGGSELLIHEASWDDPQVDPPDRPHSRADEAAQTARRAGVGRLALVHVPAARRERATAEACEYFAASYCPLPGETVEL